MKTVGILGGIASGKSEVTRIFAELGAIVFDADRVGHEVLRKPAIKEQIRQRFGSEIFDASDEVNRRQLARLVFADDAEGRSGLADLEKITHPEIRQQLVEERNRIKQDRDIPMLVLDAPVMIRAGWLAECDHILYVEASRPNRLARALTRGWSESEFDAREARQEGLDKKRKLAEYIVNNDQDLLHLRTQVLEVWDQILDPDQPSPR
jgi:dephospho-CoA kinase